MLMFNSIMLCFKLTWGVNSSIGVSTRIIHMSIMLSWVVVVMRFPTRDSLATSGCNCIAVRFKEFNLILQVIFCGLVSDGRFSLHQMVDMLFETSIFTFLSFFNIVNMLARYMLYCCSFSPS